MRFGGKEGHRGKVLVFITSYQRYILSTRPVDVDLEHLGEVVLVRSVHCKVSLPLPLPYCPLWKEVTKHSPNLRSGE